MIYVYLCRFSLPHSHLSGEIQENRPNTILRWTTLSTTLFTLADRRHVHPESLIPTSCKREIQRARARWQCLADISPVCQNGRVMRDPSVSSCCHREIGGTADARIAAPNRNVSYGSSPDPSMRKIGVRAHEWAPALNKVAAR